MYCPGTLGHFIYPTGAVKIKALARPGFLPQCGSEVAGPPAHEGYLILVPAVSWPMSS